MRLFLDTCVLYPTITRHLLLTVAAHGWFEPRWSSRVEEELRRAYARHDATGALEADAALAQMNMQFPAARVGTPEDLRAFALPDLNDAHIFAAAARASCDGIVTFNAKDFPKHILAQEGLVRLSPDEVLLAFATREPEMMRAKVTELWHIFQHSVPSSEQLSIKAFVKRAKAPRLAKYLKL